MLLASSMQRPLHRTAPPTRSYPAQLSVVLWLRSPGWREGDCVRDLVMFSWPPFKTLCSEKSLNNIFKYLYPYIYFPLIA